MVSDHSDIDRENLLLPHGLLFLISIKGSFICTIPQTGGHIPQPLLHQSWSTGWNDRDSRIQWPMSSIFRLGPPNNYKITEAKTDKTASILI